MQPKNKKRGILFAILPALFAFSLIAPKGVEGTKALSAPYLNSWDYDFNNGASGSVTDEGTYVNIAVTNAGTADWHAKLGLYQHVLEPNTFYQWDVVVKAKERMVKANFFAEQLRDSQDPLRRGERWNVELGTTKATYSLAFETTNVLKDGAVKVELLFQFGGSWNENKSGPFNLEVERITLTKMEQGTTVYQSDFSASTDGFFIEANTAKGVQASLSHASNKLVLEIQDFGTASDPWDLHLKRGDLGTALSRDVLYSFEFGVQSTNNKHYELGIEDPDFTWEKRALFEQGTISAGTTYSGQNFYPDIAIAAPTLHFQLGKEGTSPTTLTFSVIKIFAYDVYTLVHEMRVGRYVSEFATRLASVDTCVPGTLDDGYMAAPALYEDYYLRLLDPENLGTTYVKDYDYNLGEGSGPKVDGAVTVAAKWLRLVTNYNANRGANPAIPLSGRPDTKEGHFAGGNTALYVLLGLGLVSTGFYIFFKKRAI